MLYGAPNYLLQKIQRVQNAAARLNFQESKFSHAKPRLKSLHWLPVTQRIHFKLLLIIFKAIHGPAPSYISDLILVRRTGRYILRSIVIVYCFILVLKDHQQHSVTALFTWQPLRCGTAFQNTHEI